MRVNEGQVATAIPIPDKSPQSVKQAHARFTAVAARFGEVQSIIHKADEKLRQARAEDTARVAAQLVEGLEPTDPRKAEEAVEREVGDAQRLVAALTKAIDDAGDVVADAITTEQPKWREKAAKDTERALTDYHAALDALKSALNVYVEAKAIARWLTPEPITSLMGGKSKAKRGWTGSKMLIGSAGDQMWRGVPSGVSIRTDHMFRLDNPDNVTKLFPLLARVGEADVPTTVKLSGAKVAHGETIVSKEKIGA